MTADVLERQMDLVAQHIRNCSDHQRSIARIISGNATSSAPDALSVMLGPTSHPVATAPAVIPTAAALVLDIGEPAPEVESASSVASDPFEEFFMPTVQAPADPFEDVVAAVASPLSARSRPRGPLPPPSRFMMRVARLERPHRATKRNYDYFAELNAALSLLPGRSRSDNGGGTVPGEH